MCVLFSALWQIPLPVSSITDEDHPVEVGLADSFYVDRPVPPNCKQLAASVASVSGLPLALDP